MEKKIEYFNNGSRMMKNRNMMQLMRGEKQRR